MSQSPEIRAKWNKWYLLEHDDGVYEVLYKTELSPKLLKDAEGLPKDFVSFNSKDAFDFVHENGLSAIEFLGFVEFGNNNVLIIFAHTINDGVSWLLKTKMDLALNHDGTVTNYLEDDKHKMGSKKTKANSNSEVENAPKIDNRSVHAKRERSESEDLFVDQHSDTPIPSRETPETVFQSDPHVSSRDSTPHWSREASGSPDINVGRSGATPAPQPGGKIIYGRNYADVLGGIVWRNGAFQIELLDHCPTECFSPNSSSSFGPPADKKFLQEKSARKKLDTSRFKIVGCCGKWNSVEKLTTYIYVLLDPVNKKDSDDLKDYRDVESEEYKGPIICSKSTFDSYFTVSKLDKLTLVKFLKKTQFAQDALNGDKKFDVTAKILKKSATRRNPKTTVDVGTVEIMIEKAVSRAMRDLPQLLSGLSIKGNS